MNVMIFKQLLSYKGESSIVEKNVNGIPLNLVKVSAIGLQSVIFVRTPHYQ